MTRLCLALVTTVLLLPGTPASGQTALCGGGVCIPNELEAGVGITADANRRSTPLVLLLGFSFIDRTWPLDVVVEGDAGGTTSDDAECRLKEHSENCFDASLLFGPRFRLVRGRPDRHVLPFVNTFIGTYWKGSGAPDGSMESRFAVQLGGGIDLHRSESIQALRVTLDYRHVAGYGRVPVAFNQGRFAILYVLNERALTP